jgi:hypothetical protein
MNNLYNEKFWNKQEFTYSILVTWKEIANSFGITEEWDLLDENTPLEIDVIETAFQEALNQLPQTEQTENNLVEIENKIIRSITDHWSAKNVVPKHINLEKIIEKLNQASQSGPNNKKLFPVEPTLGVAIEYIENSTGIVFSLYPPFMIPYTELYYEEYNDLPEWNLEDIEACDIAETLCLAQLKYFGLLEIDLSRWDSKRPAIAL